MMNKIRKALVVVIILLGTFVAKGQQDPMYTQYIFNLQTVNPAYAGFWDRMGVLALSRNQWVGFKGHPTTQTFSIQSPMRSQNVGVGFNAVLDKVGLEKRLTVNFDYAYKVLLSDVTFLRFGVKGGFTNYSNNLLAYEQYPDNQWDPLFQTNISNKFMPNFGFGLFLSSEDYYVSLSLPRIIQNKYESNTSNYSTSSDLRQIYLAGGLLFTLSDQVKFKPTIMTKCVVGAPFQLDVTANFLLAEKFWIGAMYRSGDAFGVITQWVVNNNLRFGYAHDFTVTDLSKYHHGVHEIMLSYEFSGLFKVVSPRYF
jgi:type IX secretion system PorP/SprF family membrane protein